MIDKYGRTITVKSSGSTNTYTADGLSVSFPANTQEAIIINAFNGMAPAGWVNPPIVPQQAPMWAVRTILQNNGLFDQAQTLVTASTDNALKNVWEYGNFADRQSKSILSLGAALSLTSEQIDQMFIDANNILI